jgi:rare lipoprotein A
MLKNLIPQVLVPLALFAGTAQAAVSQPELPFSGESQEIDPRFFPREVTLGIKMASLASWYGPGFYGNRTSNGEVFTGNDMTAAHRTLPFGTLVRVTNQNTGRSVVVRINDRGPFIGGRVIDLSRAAAERLGIISSGKAPVSLQVLN